MISTTFCPKRQGRLCLSTKSGLRPFTKRLITVKLSIIFLLLGAMHVSAASAQKISISQKNAPLEKVLGEIERQSGYQVWYEEGTLPSGEVVSIAVKNASLEEALNACLNGRHLKWTIIQKTIVLKKEAQLLPFIPRPPQKISGVVKDAGTGKPLQGATVQLRGTSKATFTNASGEFELETDAREVVLEVSFIGYDAQRVKANGNQPVTILLSVGTSKLDELIITGYSAKKNGRTNRRCTKDQW